MQMQREVTPARERSHCALLSHCAALLSSNILEDTVKTRSLVAVVTGASSGIGQACAERLVNAGFAVYGTSRHPSRHKRHRDFHMLALDVRRDSSVRACIDRVVAESGHVDVLVNNSGVALQGAVEETSLEEIRELFETNFFGALRMIRAVLPLMRKRRSGRIINIGSVAGFLPMPYSAAYCASKHALHGLSESLDHEVRDFGIRVSVVEPGLIRTDIFKHAPQAAAAFEPYKSARAKPTETFRQMLEHGANPDVIANTVVDAALADDPQLIYLPDGQARLVSFLHTVLPSSIFDFALRQQMRIA
jgi:NAD(P)-dependent dehydrogenase (short-subunit alcohol dehydrogenase family)